MGKPVGVSDGEVLFQHYGNHMSVSQIAALLECDEDRVRGAIVRAWSADAERDGSPRQGG